jgi:ferredoxin
MVKIRIEFDRQNCIGSFACVALDPERWAYGSEGKADLKGGIEKENNQWVLEKNVSEEELEKIMDGARGCPVNVIHVIKVESNEKLI